MWQVFPYNQGKLKLSKDLKTANAHLRASLIDKEEINNMGKIYHNRKEYYRIDSQSFIVPSTSEETNQEEITANLGYRDKVDLYRRRLQNEKLENKFQSLFKKTEKRRHKMRKPVLHKMLEQFEEQHKHDVNVRIAEDLKESEKEVEMIKTNANRKTKFRPAVQTPVSVSRPRFISLQNGLPQKESPMLPNWIDYLQGRTTKTEVPNHMINISYLENTLDTMMGKQEIKTKRNRSHHPVRDITSPILRRELSASKAKHNLSQEGERVKKDAETVYVCERCQKLDTQKKIEEAKFSLCHSYFLSKKAEKRTTTRQPAKPEEHVSATAERTFTKSQNHSRDVINAMDSFYTTKHHKRDDYKTMVNFLKNDRPLTSDIRRRNYNVITKENISDIQKYRVHSQMERQSLKQSNQNFYLELLKHLDGHSVEDMKLSGQLIERTRRVLESNYIINQTHLDYIQQPCQWLTHDAASEEIIQKIQDLIRTQPK